MKKNRVCELLNIEFPIIQGAMAWISDAKLAASVSEAGGLGIIAGAAMELEELRKNIQLAKKITSKPFGVNLMMQREDIHEQIKICIEEKVSVVTTGAGNPAKYMEELKNANIKVIPVIPTVALARRMENIGADAIVVEGMESGGHIGKATTMALLPQVTEAVTIPVISAGGIASGKQFLASLVMGAEAVQCGTIFLVAKECKVHQNFKDALIKSNDRGTVVTGSLNGHPVRVLDNPLAEKIIELEKKGASYEEIEKISRGSLKRAVEEGDIENGSFMAGQVAGMISEEKTSKEIIDFLIKDLEKEYKNFKLNI